MSSRTQALRWPRTWRSCRWSTGPRWRSGRLRTTRGHSETLRQSAVTHHRAARVTFTRNDDVLDVFAGVVGDADVHFNGLAVVVNLETISVQTSSLERSWRTSCLEENVETPTSLSRLALTWSGLSDMTKSRVVSTEGAAPSPSGAYWTFLSISFTVLLSDREEEGSQSFFFFLILTRGGLLPVTEWVRLTACEL